MAKASPVLQPDIDQITATRGVIASATVLVNSIAARVQAGIDAALAGGATAAELQVLTDTVTGLKTDSDALAAAVAANP